MALQLQGNGEKVGLVALIDAADAKARLKTWRSISQRLHNFSSSMLEPQSARFGRRVLSVMTRALRKAMNLSAYLAGQRAKELRDEIRLRLLRFYLDRGRAVPRLLEQVPVRTVYLFAEKTYQPAAMFDGELLLFRATTGEGDDEPYINRYEDPALGWGRRATNGVRVCDVAGGHSSMLQEPNVQILAEQLQISIDEVFFKMRSAAGDRTGDPDAPGRGQFSER